MPNMIDNLIEDARTRADLGALLDYLTNKETE